MSASSPAFPCTRSFRVQVSGCFGALPLTALEGILPAASARLLRASLSPSAQAREAHVEWNPEGLLETTRGLALDLQFRVHAYRISWARGGVRGFVRWALVEEDQTSARGLDVDLHFELALGRRALAALECRCDEVDAQVRGRLVAGVRDFAAQLDAI